MHVISGLQSFPSVHERPLGPPTNLHNNVRSKIYSVLDYYSEVFYFQVIQRSHWESGAATPPMPHKRKKTKKESMLCLVLYVVNSTACVYLIV